VETTSPLNYQQQSALLVNLRKSWRDAEITDDARTLLERLRKRHDLFVTIAEEIDELLSSARPPPTGSVPLWTGAPSLGVAACSRGLGSAWMRCGKRGGRRRPWRSRP
jgi:hypothetical protein